jgi:polyribonucleotide nucleotidyltransferase
MEKIVESFELYGKQYRFETGELAKQASGAVLVTQGDTTCWSPPSSPRRRRTTTSSR